MTISTNLANNFNIVVDTFGVPFVLIHKVSTYDNYDQEILTVSGSVLGSCYFLPITEMKNGDDYQYLQQGVVREADYKIFMPSGPLVSGADLFVIGTGSYGILRWYDYTVEGNIIYKKVFVRSIY